MAVNAKLLPMTKEATLTEASRDTVRARIAYIVRSEGRPYVHTQALTGGAPRFFFELEDREVTLHDGRPMADSLDIHRQGFALLTHSTPVENLDDDEVVTRDYYPEIEALLRQQTGARDVIIFDHTRRTDAPDRSGFRDPAQRAHNDYTETSAPRRVIDLVGEDRAQELMAGAWAQLNIWRPMDGPVERSPLALLDATSLADDDLIPTDQIYPDRVGEIYHLAWNPEHRWYWFPRMTRDEVVLIKGFDSRTDGRARFTPHTAFAHPDTRDDAPPRRSLEIRALVFWPTGTDS